jgi:hypothetical protein
VCSTLVSPRCKFSPVFIVSLSCISLIHVKDCVLSCKLLCATPKLLSKVVVVCLKVTSPFCLCLNLIITGVVVDCMIMRSDLRSRSS